MTAPTTGATIRAEPAAAAPVGTSSAGPVRRSSASDAVSLVASQLIAAASTFGTGIVLARALGPSGKGFVDLTLASATLLQMLTGLSLGSGIFYHTARRGLNHRRLVLLAVGFAAALGILVALLLPALSGTPVADWLLPTAARRQAIWLVAGVLAVLQAQQLLQSVVKGRGRFVAFSASEILARAGTLVAVAVLAVATVTAPAAYVLAFGGATIAACILLAAVARRGPITVRNLPLGAIAVYSLPLYIGNLIQFLNYRLDIFFVQSSLGLDSVGRYTVAVWLAQTVWLVPNALGALVLRSVAVDPTGAGTFERVALLNRCCLALGLACACAIALLAGPGVDAVFGKAFAQSVPALLLLLPGVVIFSTVVILSAYLNGIGRQALTTWVATASLMVTVALNLWLVPRLGIRGAALASTSSYTVSAIITLVIVRRLAPELSWSALLLPRRADLQRLYGLVEARFAPRAALFDG